MVRRLWWLLVLFSLLSATNVAAGTIRLVPDRDSYNLYSFTDVLEDAQGRLRLEEVMTESAAGAFEPARGGLSSFGFTDSAFWFRFHIDNPASATRKMLLVLRTNWLDTIDFYSPDAAGTYPAQRFGDTLPFKARTYANPQFLIDLPVAPGTHTYYLRLTSAQAFMTPIELWLPEAFHANDRLLSAYYGMFYGILFVMFLYNGFIWVSIRDRNYFFYCLYLAAFFLMNFSYSGFSFQYFWPESPRWSNWSHTPWIFLYQVVAILFAMSFLESKTRMPRVHWILRAFLAAMLACWLVVTLLGAQVPFHAAPVYFVFCSAPLIVATGLVAWRTGYRAARFFVLASMASLIGSFFTALTVSGFLIYTFANFHAAEFGLMADVVLLSLALGDRIKLLREEREAAEQREAEQQLRASAQLAKANEDLERTVRERTIELARARDEAERLSLTDGLTGLANRRRFDEVLAREHARHARSGADLSLVMLDIDHFKAYNDGYGHVRGDDCLRRIAQVLAGSLVRAADFVARYGGEEFACILPETEPGGAAGIAEKIRLGIMDLGLPHNFSSTAACVTASLGVATITCSADLSAADFVVLADKMLYRAKAGGRNRVEADASHLRPRPVAAPGGQLVQLLWKTSFGCGNPLIDSQHRQLFTLANELLEAILSGRQEGVSLGLARRLLHDIAQHFQDEEAILNRTPFPGVRAHAEEHARLLKMGEELLRGLTDKSAAIGDVFKFLVYDVVLQHLLMSDREFFPFIDKDHAA